jgi:hypothetical protein
MICKQTQNNIIESLLRLKDNEDLAVHAINKIASVVQPTNTTKPTKTKGELVEFQTLLKGLT